MRPVSWFPHSGSVSRSRHRALSRCRHPFISQGDYVSETNVNKVQQLEVLCWILTGRFQDPYTLSITEVTFNLHVKRMALSCAMKTFPSPAPASVCHVKLF